MVSQVRTVALPAVAQYCDRFLDVASVRDAPEALNGLQVANAGQVTRIGAAVDLCAATVRMAAEAAVDFLVVHHGLFWGGLRPLTGPHYERVRALLEHGIALYSAHLPLDRHPEVGNAVQLAGRLGVSVRGEFGEWQGQLCGVWGELSLPRAEFAVRLEQVLGRAARNLDFGPELVHRIGIATGAGGSLIAQADALDLDTYVTGEGAHHTYFDAQEFGLNVYYGGHYATETFGVKALAEHLSVEFAIPWVFLDHPTGM